MGFAMLHSFRTSHGVFSSLAFILCKYLSLILLESTPQLITLFNYPQPSISHQNFMQMSSQNIILKTHEANFWLASSSEFFKS